MSLSVFEAGVLDSPLFGVVASLVGAPAVWGIIGFEPPAGRAYRIRSLSGTLWDAAGGVLVASRIVVGFLPRPPTALPVGHGGAVAAALWAAEWNANFIACDLTGQVATPCDLVIEHGMIAYCGALVVAPANEVHLTGTFQDAPANCRPPY
jgi:hypothetical protein